MPRKTYFDQKPTAHRVASRESKPHNRPVAPVLWQQRIRRAEHLAAQHSFATEILRFYIHVARFQEGLYQHIERTSGNTPISMSAPLEPVQLIAAFPSFLIVIEKNGPARLTEVAHDLRSAPPGAWSHLLNACWSAAGAPPSTPEEFLASAFLQPYAEFARSCSRLQLAGYTFSLCPFCNRKPALGVLRQLGDGARRNLVCSFCLAEWEFRRIVCPGCGQEDHAKLPVYTAETFPYIRVECCDACHTYIKSVDLTKNGLADPIVDELASVPFSLWAQEHGYAKLYPNLLGM
jgi:formate dehydrogenase accessory protein FdhE